MANGNRIKIRHGNSEPQLDLTTNPPTQDLLPYELGWDGNFLYINNNNIKIKKINLFGSGTGENSIIQINTQYPNSASGLMSLAIGQGCEASEAFAIAIGRQAVASGINSFVCAGWNSTVGYSEASGAGATIFGPGNTASGNYSMVFGYNCLASGDGSIAMVYKTQAKKKYAISIGDNTLANCISQTAIGKYNIEDTDDKYALIIGDGTDSARSNLLSLGWTGDLAIKGMTKGCATASLSSAGWYNIIKYNIRSTTSAKFATSISCNIELGSTYQDSNNCVHRVTMVTTYNKAPSWLNEASKSNTSTPLLDKIRYRYDKNGIGYIDVHYSGSSENNVWMKFDLGTYNTSQQRWFSQNFISVADAPSIDGTADTILGTYIFIANTGGRVAFTPTNSSSYSEYGGCWYSKDGKVCKLHVGISGITANTLTQIWTLPDYLTPLGYELARGISGTQLSNSRLTINTDGAVKVIADGTYVLADITYICQT